MLVMFDSSCPRLSRASTSRNASQIKDVDGRDKRGHDMDRAAIVTKIGIIASKHCDRRNKRNWSTHVCEDGNHCGAWLRADCTAVKFCTRNRHEGIELQ